MEDDLKVGDYGWAHFYTKCKNKITGFSCYGTIARIEKKFLLFIDNDDLEYITEKKTFEFTQCERGKETKK
jgi:hypothetical protein